MAGLDEKITELDPLHDPQPNDVFPVVDIDQVETKKITKATLMGKPGPIGNGIASTGEFTTIELTTGAIPNEFSIDGTLAGDSDLAIPTERAVKTYVDASAGGLHNDLSGLQGGDSTASEFYHLTAQTYNFISSDSTSLIIAGNIHCDDLFTSASTINVGTGQIKSTAGNVELYHSGVKKLETSSAGMLVGDGVAVGCFMYYNSSLDYYIDNLEPGGLLVLQGEQAATGLATILSGDPDGAAELYYAGAKTFETMSGGFALTSGSNTGSYFFDGDNLTIRSDVNGGHILLECDRTGGSTSYVAKFDPDGAAELYFASVKSMYTQAGGIVVTDASANKGVVIIDSNDTPGELWLRSKVNGGLVRIRGNKSAAVPADLVTLDPDGAAELYYAGDKKFETTPTGVLVRDDLEINGALTINSSDTTALVVVGDIHCNDLFTSASTINVGSGQIKSTAGNIELYHDGGMKLDTAEWGVRIYSAAQYFMTLISSVGDTKCQVYSVPHGYSIELAAEDAGGTPRATFTGDPDGAAEIYYAGTKTFETTSDGIKLNAGAATINEFSTDGTLSGDSDTAVPTEKAVKSYVDTQIGLGIETGNYNMSTGDTTASITFVQQQGSSNYSVAYSIINTVDNPPLLFVSGIFEKTVDGFSVMFSSPMDTDNYVVSWIVTDALLGSSSSSSSSSSTSSSSTSTSSSSESSISESSISDASFMGAGWPYLPDTMQVVIGTRWNEANLNFVEDDVITLKRYGQDGVSISYTEDGTLVGNAVTNRLRIRYRGFAGVAIAIDLTVANTAGSFKQAGNFDDSITGITPYDFKGWWDLSPSWTEWFATQASSGLYFTNISYYYNQTANPLQYQGEVFKSITFIDN